ncbi:phosphoribosylformimino-5-aminoimidazole carboxamide ribotide isomerase [Lacrimispora sp. NSJ-141]|uniref:Phosphoribosylformimino-5-aminoimidazole carboxamide ribotide isomerase n=1 Tax=Lientehia hominis TaxID=2897778 RepID=A0AAP2RI23_9FIRM|nr:phosphoribosylformimino-5-aminoimidazole carboxamide ribotide isomerase [Lientehia hominis]MCD2491718.1 phosphoribosylformimino-5-aminoimidazole carboxamide ribotide isomerase [Lientehia hominis]
MRFRPCIDIHNGKVKQIIGDSLKDAGNRARENFVAEQDAEFYAEFYKKDGLRGGHVILLNPAGSDYYEATKRQAAKALAAYSGGFQLGGGINDRNAEEFLNLGASHVIVTSFVFRDGRMEERNLERMIRAVGKERLVLDLSCRKKDGGYYIVTDRWQKFTEVPVTAEILGQLSAGCNEFLIHAVDVEGKASGVERELLSMLGGFTGIPVTYAGGVGSFSDLREVKELGRGHVDVTIGSALDLFGGDMKYNEVLACMG